MSMFDIGLMQTMTIMSNSIHTPYGINSALVTKPHQYLKRAWLILHFLFETRCTSSSLGVSMSSLNKTRASSSRSTVLLCHSPGDVAAGLATMSYGRFSEL